MTDYSNLTDWLGETSGNHVITQLDGTCLHISRKNDEYVLFNRIPSPWKVLSRHETLQAAKVAYVMARSIGIGVPKS